MEVFMREVQAFNAKIHLLQSLYAAERGKTIVITRHDRPIARLVSEAERRQAEIRAAIDTLKALRRMGPKLSAEEIRALINEGRTYRCRSCSTPLLSSPGRFLTSTIRLRPPPRTVWKWTMV
jgi:prevent-host-death family protein